MVDLSNAVLEEVKPVNLKQTFSFASHIELYETCSLQYKFFKELGFIRYMTILCGCFEMKINSRMRSIAR